MKWKLRDDERWLWTELAHSSFDVSTLVRPEKEPSDFRALETVLNREILRLTWWRWPLSILWIAAVYTLVTYSVIDVLQGKYPFPRNVIQPVGTVFQVAIGSSWLFFYGKPSNRWRNGVELAARLSHSVLPRSSVDLLITILTWDEIRLQLNKKSLAPVLYHRLADVLMHLDDWKPTPAQRQLLQRIALSGRNAITNEQRYPDALRIAALLILGDEPTALDEKFRARIDTLTRQDSTEDGVKAAVGEVLRRR